MMATPACTPTPEPPESQQRTPEDADDFAVVGRVWTAKVALVTSAVALVIVAPLLALLFLAAPDLPLRLLVRWLTSETARQISEDTARGVAWLVAAAVVDFAVFAVSLLCVWWSALATGRWTAQRGEFSRWGVVCVGIARGSVAAGCFQSVAGLGILAGATALVLHVAGLVGLGWLYPLIAGTGLALLATGAATLLRLPVSLEPPAQLPEEESLSVYVPREARISGAQLLDRLRKSPIYRRQLHFFKELDAAGFVSDVNGGGLQSLLQRFPLLGAVLGQTEVRTLTRDQARALEEWTKMDRAVDGEPKDLLLFGWPGSGRSTVANLIALGTALHREGATCWVVPERRDRSAAGPDRRTAASRHPLAQIERWLGGTAFDVLINRQESYVDVADSRLDLARQPDLIVTDVRTLQQELLARLSRDEGRLLLERLRYVVVDHPHRLSREDLVRLRVALARLRLTAELLGRRITFIVNMTRFDDAISFAKALVSNEHVVRIDFGNWYGACHLMGWQAAPELLDFADDERPRFVRGRFTDDVLDLLAELGIQAHRLGRETAGDAPATPTRIASLAVAVADTGPLLGPEFREQVEVLVRERLLEDGADRDAVSPIVASWSYFLTSDVAVDLREAFDVIVCLGLGNHPEQLVSSLRPAVANHGALILVADCSPADVESLKVMANRSWNPREPIAEARFPGFVSPTPGEAVTAHELAQLFEDFDGRPVARERLDDGIFPKEHARHLLDGWIDEGVIAPCRVFDRRGTPSRPQIRTYVRRVGRALTASRYEIAPGCCSRRVYQVWDVHGRRPDSSIGRHATSHIDVDRLFIDFHPFAVLRFPPVTVMVQGREDLELNVAMEEQTSRRSVVVGRVNVEHRGIERSLAIDRRAPRFDVRLLAERPFSVRVAGGPNGEQNEPHDLHSILPVLTLPAMQSLAAPIAAEALRRAIVGRLHRPLLARSRQATRSPVAHVEIGDWICQLHERMRDVVRTDARLIEEPFLTSVEPLPTDEQRAMERTFESVGVHVFVRPSTSASLSEAARAALDSYAAHHALGRVVAVALRRRLTNFDEEYRLTVVENIGLSAEPGGMPLSRWRLLFYRLRDAELDPDRGVMSKLDQTETLQPIVEWAHDRLLNCHCDDGCSVCCGGLGTVSVKEFESDGTRARFTERDQISRWGAYVLCCLLLGQEPDRTAFEAGPRASIETFTTDHDDLQPMVDDVIGTPEGRYQDGIWTQLFGELMVLPPDQVATAHWMEEPPPERKGCIGYYSPAVNRVHIGRGLDPIATREVIAHEYAHNWQSRSGRFNANEHATSPDAQRYFDGKLIVEGHATWCETQFRFRVGLGPAFTLKDVRYWSEYKVGYFLMEGLEKAVGEYGLFTWLAEGSRSTERIVRSRNRELRWPFTLREALLVLRPEGRLSAMPLLRFCRRAKFTVVDVETATGISNPDPSGSKSATAQGSQGVTA
jgi:hypothetical protein